MSSLPFHDLALSSCGLPMTSPKLRYRRRISFRRNKGKSAGSVSQKLASAFDLTKKVSSANLQHLEELNEDEFAGILAFGLQFCFSCLSGMVMQYFFSDKVSTCSADTSVSFEHGVAIGSILAYLTMAFSTEPTASVLRYIYTNFDGIFIEISRVYGVVVIGFFIQRVLMMPYIFDESNQKLFVFLPLLVSISGQLNHISETFLALSFSFAGAKTNFTRNRILSGCINAKQVLYYVSIVCGFIFIFTNVVFPSKIHVLIKSSSFGSVGNTTNIVYPSPRFSDLIFGNCVRKPSFSKQSDADNEKKGEEYEDDFRFIPVKRAEALEVLQLPSNNAAIDFKDIKIAFKKLALKFHPDKCNENPRDFCTSRFIKIQQAYAYLERWENRKKQSRTTTPGK